MFKKIKIFESGKSKLLVYRKEYSNKFIKKKIAQLNLDGLRIFYYPNEIVDDLSFLAELDFLEELSIGLIKEVDFSFLPKLKNLKNLNISTHFKKTIDLTNLKHLEEFSISYFDKNANIIGLENSLKLKKIFLDEYHFDTLENLGQLDALERLTIKSSKLRSLRGIKNFPKLKHLYVGGIRRLKSISDINQMQYLEKVIIDGCRQINDFDKLTEIPNLKMMEIRDNGNMSYAPFLDMLFKTKRLKIGPLTKIENIEEILTKKEQELKDKKHKEKLKRNREILKKARLDAGFKK